jgi:hypothetical protein
MYALPPERPPHPLVWQVQEHPVAAAVLVVVLAVVSVLLASFGGLLLLLYDRPIGDGDGCKGWDAPVSGMGLLSFAVALLLTALAGEAIRGEAVRKGTWRKPNGIRAILFFFIAGTVLVVIGNLLPCHDYHHR